MGSSGLLNIMRMQSALEQGRRVFSKLGLVDSYDSENYCCKVRIQPEDPENPAGSLTGWLPIMALCAGNGFGIQVGLKVETQVKVSFIEGDIHSGVVELCQFNDVDRPMSVPEGEIWIKHEKGATLKFLNDGTIATTATINHKGDLNVDGSVTSTRGDTGAFMDQQGNLIEVVAGLIVGGVS